jgi:hypothetical protein
MHIREEDGSSWQRILDVVGNLAGLKGHNQS